MYKIKYGELDQIFLSNIDYKRIELEINTIVVWYNKCSGSPYSIPIGIETN